VHAFPQGEVMEKVIRKIGFSRVEWRRYTFGICTMYLAKKD
jgi:demethylmenaquinone methyltransferase/2-methoxy-6-polyprenyl-1,4-benzoquinol methylase